VKTSRRNATGRSAIGSKHRRRNRPRPRLFYEVLVGAVGSLLATIITALVVLLYYKPPTGPHIHVRILEPIPDVGHDRDLAVLAISNTGQQKATDLRVCIYASEIILLEPDPSQWYVRDTSSARPDRIYRSHGGSRVGFVYASLPGESTILTVFPIQSGTILRSSLFSIVTGEAGVIPLSEYEVYTIHGSGRVEEVP
jgi:hypothetical protein